MTIQQQVFAPLQLLNGGDRPVEYSALFRRPALKGRLPRGKQLGDSLLSVLELLAEAGQHLLSLRDPGLELRALPAAARPPPRPDLRQLSLEALQDQFFLGTVTPGAVEGALRDRNLKLQRTLRLKSGLLDPAEQVVGAGGPQLLGQFGRECICGWGQSRASFSAQPPAAVLTSPFHGRSSRSLVQARFRPRPKHDIGFLGPRLPVLDHLDGDRLVGTVIVLTSISSGRCVDGANLWR
jgi:hypothetical protein